MVEVVEAKIEEFESAEACFTSETFGNVCLKVSPLKAKVLKVVDGYSISPKSTSLGGSVVGASPIQAVPQQQ
ncbi:MULTISPECIES: hypothetical protein [Pyrobaculum]|uniref:Uncharacterized protein n=1 Tax=Pyrobaculum arsenaticum TaxID=121277 RepID=A0A7L4P7I0_9CREN|nr:hypothetical protein [Pyrobaculum arsenaticum]MCY0890216.1 hypothetical protein [Pyrobaculum arsenaticum]NYR15015.1 hypothetical protein [Pyrobaculum arsenaticum]